MIIGCDTYRIITSIVVHGSIPVHIHIHIHVPVRICIGHGVVINTHI